MNRKQKKQTQWNHLIVLMLAVAMMIICAPAVFAGSAEDTGTMEEHGAIVDVEYTPAEAFCYYEELYCQWDGYEVCGDITPDDSVKVIYEDGTIADCSYYKQLAGLHNWKTPEGFNVEVDKGYSNQSDKDAWKDPASEKLVTIWIRVCDSNIEELRINKQLPVVFRESPVESITYTQVAGIPVKVLGYANYKPNCAYGCFYPLSASARRDGDIITVKYKNQTKPVEYVLHDTDWIAADGSRLEHVSFYAEGEDEILSDGDDYPKYKTGRYTVEVKVLGAETEYCFDIIDDPVASIAYTPSTIVVGKTENYDPETGTYNLRNSRMDAYGNLFAEGDVVQINYKDGSVGRYTYDETTGYFCNASGQKLPYFGKFTMRMARNYEIKEGRNQDAIEIQYGLNHIQMVDLIIEDSHKLVRTPEKAATTKAAGNKQCYTCSTCGMHFKDAEGLNEFGQNEWVIPKLKVQKAAVKNTAKKVNIKTLKRKTVTVAPLKVTSNKGAVSYKVVGGTAKAKKALKLNQKNGKITVKKKTAKGTYTIKVKVTAKSAAGYAEFSKNVNVTVEVR